MSYTRAIPEDISELTDEFTEDRVTKVDSALKSPRII